MIYTAEEFGSADIMDEMERKVRTAQPYSRCLLLQPKRTNDGRCNRNSGLP